MNPNEAAPRTPAPLSGGKRKRPSTEPVVDGSGTAEQSHSHRIKYDIPRCADIRNFSKGERVGKGTYGLVFRGEDLTKPAKHPHRICALKQILKQDNHAAGFPKSALREISILRKLEHPSIVKLLDVVLDEESEESVCYLMFEYCGHDLSRILKTHKRPFSPGNIKRIMFALVHGLTYLHGRLVVHRDLKMANLLYTRGEVKIADFGMARVMSQPHKPYTPKVITMWYRCPELLLDESEYDASVDIWSLGCIFGELIKGEAVLMGNSDIEQISLILKFRGILAADDIDKVKHLSISKLTESRRNVGKEIPGLSLLFDRYRVSRGAQELMLNFFEFNPRKRMSAKDATRHYYFNSEQPFASNIGDMPTFLTKVKKEGR